MQAPEHPAQRDPKTTRRRPPAGLVGLLAIVLTFGVVWALVVPPWQSPDEVAHFAYVQNLAENLALPGQIGRSEVSSDQRVADDAVGASRGAFYPQSAPPDWNPGDFRAYLTQGPTGLPADNGGGPNPASSNPPLYYAYAAIAYLADGSDTAFGRLYAIRIWNVLLLMLSALGGWLLAGEVLGRRRLGQLASGAIAGLMPMESFVAVSVSPDGLMVALWTIAFWLGARVIERQARRADALLLTLTVAAAVLTKVTSYALVPAALFALVVGWRRRAPSERGRLVHELGPSAAALALPILAWLALAHALGRSAVPAISTTRPTQRFNARQFLSYVWQFYFPRLPFLHRFRTTGALGLYDIWIRGGTGQFGWLSVSLPEWVYTAVSAGAAGVAAACVRLLARARRPGQWGLMAFFALALVALIAGLHITDYRSIVAGDGPILQGRYLLPVLGLFGLAIGLLVSRVPAQWRAGVCGALLIALFGLQALALVAVLRVFYV